MENEKRYTVVIYNPSGSTYCMGNVMSSWESNFSVHYEKTRDEMIILIAGAKAQTALDQTDPPQYEIFEGDPVDTELLEIDPEIKAQTERLITEGKARIEVERQRQKDINAKREQAFKRVQYERLKAELEKEENK